MRLRDIFPLSATLALVSVALAPSCRGASKPQTSAVEATATRLTTEDGCRYLPSFITLRDRIGQLDTDAALRALNAYAADPANENPNACQSIALDAAIGEREQALVTLRLANGRSVPAHASYRCDTVEPSTTACRGAVEDATAHPFSTGVFRDGAKPIALAKPTSATIASALTGATLEAVYRVRVPDLLDGGRANKLPPAAPVTLAPDQALMAVIAIYSTPDGPKRHKLVWYYGLNLS